MNKLTIGIDASRAIPKNKTGVQHYSEQIIYYISKIDKKNKYILYSEKPPLPGSLMDKLPNNFTWKIIPFGYIWTQVRLSWQMFLDKNKLDVLFVPAHTIPLVHPKKTVVTVHDMGFEYYPKLYAKNPIGPKNPIIRSIFNIGSRIATLGKYGNSELDYHRWATRHCIKNTTKIIAISKFTKNDAINIYNANPKNIEVIYHGFNSHHFKPLSQEKNKQASKKLTEKHKPYFFFVGRVESKKNMINMLKAFCKAKETDKIPHKFIIAGMPGLGYNKIHKYIKSLPSKIQQSIIELGYTKDQDVAYWMQNADAFLFVTNFEGFGMPILEAFQSEIPVITSKTTACPEVAKDAAIKVNPKSVDEIYDAIIKLIKDKSFAEKLSKKGHKRVKKFSWLEAAKKTHDIIIKTAQK